MTILVNTRDERIDSASKDRTLELYEGHYHDLLNDIGKEQVMDDIRQWIGAHLPSA